jgi:hypothetical protein
VEKRYIGETDRLVKIRLKEKSTDIQCGRIKNFVVVEYSCSTNHHMFLEDSKVLETIMHYYKRTIRKVLEIKKFTNNINCDNGLKLRESWIPIVNLIKK